MRKRIILYITVAICLLGTYACGNKSNPQGENRRVLVFFQLGFNNLSSYLNENIDALCTGWLPLNKEKGRENILLVFSKSTVNGYGEQTEPVLYRIYANKKDGAIIRDTLYKWPKGAVSATGQMITDVFNYVQKHFPAESYGALMSSHGTGWLPEKYYSNPGLFKNEVVKYSFGAEFYPDYNRKGPYEIGIPELRAAIPVHLDYLLFDACLMGGIEVAYELKDVTSFIAFSQAEVLGDGLFDYTTLTTHLLKGEQQLLENVCYNSFSMFNSQTGNNKSVTISLVDCGKLGSLAGACTPLFEKYRQQISELDYRTVQEFGGRYHYFFDLVDIIREAGANGSELKTLQDALDQCIVYKAHTGQYFSSSDNRTHAIDNSKFSGLSMYFPYAGNDYLNSYYQSLSWNKVTSLVK